MPLGDRGGDLAPDPQALFEAGAGLAWRGTGLAYRGGGRQRRSDHFPDLRRVPAPGNEVVEDDVAVGDPNLAARQLAVVIGWKNRDRDFR